MSVCDNERRRAQYRKIDYVRFFGWIRRSRHALHWLLAMNVQADILWDKTIIAASVGIAVAASIVALWLAVHVKHMWQMVVSALVMGVAVFGIHYTGMVVASGA